MGRGTLNADTGYFGRIRMLLKMIAFGVEILALTGGDDCGQDHLYVSKGLLVETAG